MQLDIELKPDMLSDLVCRNILRSIFHPDGAACPACAAFPSGGDWSKWFMGRSVKCRSCNTEFTWRTATPMAGKGVDECQLITIILLTRYGRPQSEIADACNLSTRTVRRYQRMLEAFNQ